MWITATLSHEKKDCPLLPPALRSSSSHLGVTQLNTLDRLEANRRRLEDRRPPRQLSLSRDREWRREPSHSLHRSSDKTYVSDYIRRDYRKNYDSQGCYERDRTSLARRTDDYSLSRSENQRNHTARPPPGHPPPPTWRPVTMAGNLKTPTQSIQSQVSHTPSPRPLREVMLPPGNATARNTGDHEPHSRERRSALERISVPGHDTDRTEAQHEKVSSTKSPGSQQHGTEERRSALERLTSPITPGHGVIDSQQMHDPTMRPQMYLLWRKCDAASRTSIGSTNTSSSSPQRSGQSGLGSPSGSKHSVPGRHSPTCLWGSLSRLKLEGSNFQLWYC
ncbi:hypothetical protein Bca52824_064559 [Brassica carinata]|uniref:Uncharacterized protein n=1 Tax=Brassica carinata TaxID=52824 RepID=A0A8X7QGL5_BRACI|nr:hypothetical protein Bca52824_064559 [Brassica carinata]